MATPQASDDPATQSHYAAQATIAAALVAALARLWPMIDLSNLKVTLPRYTAAVAAQVNRHALASASVAADYFDEKRFEAGVRSAFSAPMVDPPTLERVQDQVQWATQDLWSTPGDTEQASPEVVEAAQSKAEGALEKLVLDTGRNELIEAIEADTEARGFARVAKPGACPFCLMLATRGAVYKSREAAGAVEASTKWADAKGEINRYHDNCHCTVQPLFGRHYEAPAHIREAEAIYQEAQQGLPSPASSTDRLNAFRRALAHQ